MFKLFILILIVSYSLFGWSYLSTWTQGFFNFNFWIAGWIVLIPSIIGITLTFEESEFILNNIYQHENSKKLSLENKPNSQKTMIRETVDASFKTLDRFSNTLDKKDLEVKNHEKISKSHLTIKETVLKAF